VTSGTTGLSGSRSSAAPLTHFSSSSEDEQAAGNSNNEGLVLARPVQENDPNMPVAIEMNDDGEGTRSKTQEEKEEESANR